MIQQDIVIRFNSLTFAWTALSGFQSTGIPFFPKPPFRVFNLPGVQICVLSLIFARIFLVRRDALVLPRCINLASLLCVVSFNYVRIYRVRQVVAIHGGQYHCSTREYDFDYKRSFMKFWQQILNVTVNVMTPYLTNCTHTKQ